MALTVASGGSCIFCGKRKVPCNRNTLCSTCLWPGNERCVCEEVPGRHRNIWILPNYVNCACSIFLWPLYDAAYRFSRKVVIEELRIWSGMQPSTRTAPFTYTDTSALYVYWPSTSHAACRQSFPPSIESSCTDVLSEPRAVLCHP